MKLLFWRKQPEPETPKNLSLHDLPMDSDERESLYRLLHHLDGIELHRRVEFPLERAQDASEIVIHFRDRGVDLPWDVDQLKGMIVAYEEKAA